MLKNESNSLRAEDLKWALEWLIGAQPNGRDRQADLERLVSVPSLKRSGASTSDLHRLAHLTSEQVSQKASTWNHNDAQLVQGLLARSGTFTEINSWLAEQTGLEDGALRRRRRELLLAAANLLLDDDEVVASDDEPAEPIVALDDAKPHRVEYANWIIGILASVVVLVGAIFGIYRWLQTDEVAVTADESTSDTTSPPTTTAPPDGFTSCAQVEEISASECDVLVDLYESTSGSDWNLDDNRWLQTTTPCGQRPGTGWQGISCDSGRVSEIQLSSRGLSGELPASLSGLTGLTSLSLQDNDLAGSIPETMVALQGLASCELTLNQFSLEVSGALSSFLEENCPGWWSGPFQGCDSIKVLTPSECSALIDIWEQTEEWQPSQWIAEPTKNWLVTDTPCGGPDFGWSSVLCKEGRVTALYLGELQMTGTIPDSIGQLEGLTELYLYENSLTGSVPAAIASLPNLETCALWANDFAVESVEVDVADRLTELCPNWAIDTKPEGFG